MASFFNVFRFKKDSHVIEESGDHERCFNDLLFDVKQKRKLTYLLFEQNKRLRITFKAYVVLSIITFIGIFFSFHQQSNEKRIFKQHYSNFKKRHITSYGLGVNNGNDFRSSLTLIKEYNIVVESKMLVALASIEDKKFDDAILVLDGLNTPESEWLESLCYLRKKDFTIAFNKFEQIIECEGLFAAEAKEILKEYRNQYQKN